MRWKLAGLLLLLAILPGAMIWRIPIPTVVSSVQVPGPSLALYNAQTYYSCSNNRYVSTTGSSSNNGLTSGSPWDIATAAAYAAPAGTCVNLAPGNYSTITISNGGTVSTKTGYVVWRCTTMPFSFSNGILQGEGSGCILTGETSISVSYVMLDGFEFNGSSGAFGVPLDDENGPATSLNPSHHVWVMNSDIHDGAQSGIQWNYSEWFFIIHNVWHDNAYNTGCPPCGSGLSLYEPVGISYTPTIGNPDYWHSATTGLTYHIVVAYNVGYHNHNGNGVGGDSDGEGIILDDWGHAQNACPGSGTCPYNGNALIMGNIMYNNGGPGIESFSFDGSGAPKFTGNVTIVNNTTYANMWDSHNTGTFRGDNYTNDGLNLSVFNNASYALIGSGILADNGAFFANGNSGASGNTWRTNVAFPTTTGNFDGTNNTYPTTGTNKNLDNTNPNFVSASCNIATATCTSPINFALQAGSPAIGFGQAFDLWQQAGSVDAGACVSTLTSCP